LRTPQTFTVKKLDNATMPAEDHDALAEFKAEVTEMSRAVDAAIRAIREVDDELSHVRVAISRMEVPSADLMNDVRLLEAEMRDLRRGMLGDGVAAALDIGTPPSVSNRIGFIVYEQKYSTSAPTGTHMASLAIAREEFTPLLARLRKVLEQDMVALRESLRDAGAPYTPNALLELLPNGE
jgi:hypothetical protein